MKQQRALLLYANAGLFCDGYILSSIGIALVSLQPRFHLNSTSTGLIGAATLIGILVGAPLFGHFTDRYGRRILMIADLCVFVIVCILQAFSGAVWMLIFWRFLLGLAIGADYPIAAALIGESVPARSRGAAVNSMQVAWFAGAAVAYAAGYVFLRAAGAESWRWILASPALFALLGLLLRASAPESALWLASRETGTLARTPFWAMFRSQHRGALAFVSAMWLLQVIPLFAIYAFAPAVLAALGINDQSSPLGGIAITAAFLIGSLLSLPLVERWGRRPLCIGGFAVGVGAFALLLLNKPNVVIVAFVAYAIGIGAAAGLELTYPVELFPTPIRASATGFAAAISRIGAALGTFALPALLLHFGIATILKGAWVLCAIGLAVALRWAPETKGTVLS